MKKLNFGCGTDYKEGWINADIDKNVKADVYINRNKRRYPFKDNEFDLIMLKMVLEHVDSPLHVLEELWRISKKGAKIIIEVPHWSSYLQYTDLTHRHAFSLLSFHYFERNSPKYYSDFADFKILSKKCKTFRTNNKFWKPYEWLCKYVLEAILNANHLVTEQILCKFLPVNEIDFVLEVKK